MIIQLDQVIPCKRGLGGVIYCQRRRRAWSIDQLGALPPECTSRLSKLQTAAGDAMRCPRNSHHAIRKWQVSSMSQTGSQADAPAGGWSSYGTLTKPPQHERSDSIYPFGPFFSNGDTAFKAAGIHGCSDQFRGQTNIPAGYCRLHSQMTSSVVDRHRIPSHRSCLDSRQSTSHGLHDQPETTGSPA